MECKYNRTTEKDILDLVEVAPYWNVNPFYKFIGNCINYVEVAPYWNVNTFRINNYIKDYAVEVAPYWNVNINSA